MEREDLVENIRKAQDFQSLIQILVFWPMLSIQFKFKETEAEIQKAAVKGGPVQETHSQADELQGSSHARG